MVCGRAAVEEEVTLYQDTMVSSGTSLYIWQTRTLIHDREGGRTEREGRGES